MMFLVFFRSFFMFLLYCLILVFYDFNSKNTPALMASIICALRSKLKEHTVAEGHILVVPI